MATTQAPPLSPAPETLDAARVRGLANPWPWLLVILAVGVALRAWNLSNAFQLDEFNTVAAVAERAGVPINSTATEADPLAPVSGLDEVGRRSVMPFGIRNPVPLHHYVVHTFLRFLPVADWSVRLPSLLAGVGCILGIYFLTRRLFGVEVALVAAAFTALDPIQVSTSWLARPYALANLAVVTSFLFLVRLYDARATLCAALWAAGYGAAVAAIGYFSPLSLLVVPAQVAVMLYALRPGATEGRAGGVSAWLRLALGLGGLALAAALMAPLYGYWSQVAAFAQEHSDYLIALLGKIMVMTLFWHNLALIGGLALIVLATMVIRWQVEGEDADAQAAPDTSAGAAAAAAGGVPVTPAVPAVPAVPAGAGAVTGPADALLPENEAGGWMARTWTFLPQLLLLLVAGTAVQSIFLTRHLSYTTLGAAVLLAYVATRNRSREVRLGVAATVCLALLLLGFFSERSSGLGLFSNERGREIVKALRGLEDKGVWKEGDAVLVRSGQPEADFLGRGIPAENRPHVERALLAPLNTLYADAARRPLVALTRTQARGDKFRSGPGHLAPLDAFYDDAFAARLQGHSRFWVTGLTSGRDFIEPSYLACLVPWLADRANRDYSVSRNRGTPGEPQRYVEVPTAVGPEDDIDGLTFNVLPTDFVQPIHAIRPRQPAGIFTFGAVGRGLLPGAHVGVPVMLRTEFPTPRLTADPNPVRDEATAPEAP